MTNISNRILSRRHTRMQTLVSILLQDSFNLLIRSSDIVLVLPLNMQIQLSTTNRHLFSWLDIHPSQGHRAVRLLLHLSQERLTARLLSRIQRIVVDLEVIREEIRPFDSLVLELVDQLGHFLHSILHRSHDLMFRDWLFHRPDGNLQYLLSRQLVVVLHRLWYCLHCLTD